jgi:hypothetical protein
MWDILYHNSINGTLNAMTEKFSASTLRIPTALVIVIVTIILSIFSWGVATSRSSAADHKQIEVNTSVINNELKPDIKDLQNNKADKVDLDRIYKTLERIENKLDSHMEKK